MDNLPGYDNWLSRPYEEQASYFKGMDKYEQYLSEFWENAQIEYDKYHAQDLSDEEKYATLKDFVLDNMDLPLKYSLWLEEQYIDAMYEAGDRAFEEMRDREYQ